ncbi:MAG: SpoIIE family protein phosphatase [Chloroflexota bacterium]
MTDSLSKKSTILIVDDTPTNLDMLFDYLDAHHFKVLVAESGEEALKRVTVAQPDLILLDIMMPGIDGFETCRRLKAQEETKDIPVIFMTALTEIKNKVAGFEIGAVDYITKPFQYKDVLVRVNTHLTLRNLQKQLEVQNSQLQQEIDIRNKVESQLQNSNQRLQKLTDRFQSELALAKDIQLGLLPSPSPEWAELDAVCYINSASEVGGDFYAYRAVDTYRHPTPPHFSLAIGDVSGKGMPAALLMTLSLALLQTTWVQPLSPAQVLTQLNHLLLPYTQTTNQRCALTYIDIVIPAITTSTRPVHIANAGGIPPIVRYADGSVEWVTAVGMPLGLEYGEQLGYQDIKLDLSKGDMVILTSDGVIEAINDESLMFGFDRFEEAVKNAPKNGSAAMIEHLKQTVAQFMGKAEPVDDITMIAVKM